MQMAVETAKREHGVGLHFPCPSEYKANSFLSELSANLAAEVLGSIRRSRIADRSVTAIWATAGAVTLVLAAVAAMRVALHTASGDVLAAITPATVPLTLRYAASGALVIFALGFAFSRRPRQRRRALLAREAASMRERMRFSASLQLASETGLSSARILTATISRSRQRTLSERPVTTAALVFDFRNFAGLVATTVPGPVVIGIDELDKMSDSSELRRLLRNVKGIFDVKRVTYLVSISDEAASFLHLGAVKSGRNEFNSSFYQVIDVPRLTPQDARELLAKRQLAYTGKLAELLCILAGGNQRELLRMADSCKTYANEADAVLDHQIVRLLLADESEALLHDIIRNPADEVRDEAGDAGPDRATMRAVSAKAKYEAMRALPRSAFWTMPSFVQLGSQSLQDELWSPRWRSPEWEWVQDQWRRFLVRFCMTSLVLQPPEAGLPDVLDNDAIVTDLRDVIRMSLLDPSVARQMLFERFGSYLPHHPYQACPD